MRTDAVLPAGCGLLRLGTHLNASPETVYPLGTVDVITMLLQRSISTAKAHTGPPQNGQPCEEIQSQEQKSADSTNKHKPDTENTEVGKGL